MAYFKSEYTEAEVKERFRELLQKYDYRNPNKQELIDAIRREYEKKLIMIKCAATHRSGTKSYTRQEYMQLILAQKKCINRVLQKIVRIDKVRYVMLRQQLNFDNYVDVYSRFNVIAFLNEDSKTCEVYYFLRREIEFATEYLAKDEKEYDALMVQIENMMGKHIHETMSEYEKKYIDPIEMQQLDTICNFVTATPGENRMSEMELYSGVANVIILLFLVMAILLKEIMIVMFALPFVLWVGFVKIWDIFVLEAYDKSDRRLHTYSKDKEKKGFQEQCLGFAKKTVEKIKSLVKK
uniref:hypothetical protein n=1 Tax=Acetatifactor sp. TaxID=1872090 RepID=UPI004055AECA